MYFEANKNKKNASVKYSSMNKEELISELNQLNAKITKLERIRHDSDNNELGQSSQIKNSFKLGNDKADLIYSFIPIAIFTVDKDGYVTSWNRKAVEITGFSEEEVIGNKCTVFTDHPCTEKCGLFSDEVKKPIENKECTIKTKTGEIKHICKNAALLKNNNGEIIGGIESFEDITERKNAIKALKENEEKYRKIFESFKDILFKTDLDGKIEVISPSVKSMLELDPDQLINKNLRDIYSDPYDRDDILKKVIIEKEINNCELRLLNREGGEIDSALNARLTFHEDGTPTGIEGVFRDIRDQKRTEDEIKRYIEEVQESQLIMEQSAHELVVLNSKLEESEEELQILNASKDKFFSIIAHDLKSPFTVMLGFTEMLEMEFEDLSQEELKEAIVSLNRTAQNVYELLEGLLDWSRIQTGRMEFSPRRFELKDVSRSVKSLLDGNARGKQIIINDSVEEDIFVFADKNMVNAIIRNLTANAIKFTKPGGAVSIHTTKKKDYVHVIISDTGIGISEEDLAKLFRIDIHYTTYGTNNEKGTGLGLILCKELIEKNNGKIWVESILGKGSKFVFTLPSRVSNV